MPQSIRSRPSTIDPRDSPSARSEIRGRVVCNGGDVHLFDPPADRPAVSLVFVQSLDGNTGAANPDDIGGGPTDKHLIYEGVSRVAADAVLAGATTAAGTNTFFSIWHPELVHLRQDLGLPRHPAQIVLSRHGRVDPDRTLLFNVPDVPVVVLVETGCHDRCRQQFADRPWVNVIPVNSDDVAAALGRLRKEHGIRRISAIGGRAAASSLLDAGLVQDSVADHRALGRRRAEHAVLHGPAPGVLRSHRPQAGDRRDRSHRLRAIESAVSESRAPVSRRLKRR